LPRETGLRKKHNNALHRSGGRRGFLQFQVVRRRPVNAVVMPQDTMNHEAVDRALGGNEQAPQPLVTGLSAVERDSILERSLWFPDRPLPTGELADWAVTLIDLGKDAAVTASMVAVETAASLAPAGSPDLQFVNTVLAELHVWANSTKGIEDLRRLGDLWWSLTRNPPQSADTPLGDAVVMAWIVAGYDPEGWGNPPEDAAKVHAWLSEAANNVTAVVDVFSCVQQSVGSKNEHSIIQNVRSALCKWRETTVA
jgi:hypothetical protein